MEMINYDVLIPARNEESNIKKTLESINNQTIKPNSIIVVNDNSVDNTEKIATSTGAKVVNFPYQHKNWVINGKLGIVFSFGMNFFNFLGAFFIFLFNALKSFIKTIRSALS